MNEQVPLMEVLCVEKSGPIIRKVTPTRLTLERAKFLWEKMSQFKTIFNDFTTGDPAAFIEHFVTQDAAGNLHPAGLMWDVDDVGMFFLNELNPPESAEAHFVFWDEKFNGREELCRRMLRYVFDKFKFQRINVRVPVYMPHTLNAVERIGFVQEGRLRKAILYENKWYDVNLYGILLEDIADEHKPFKSKLDSRFVCPSCGDRLFKKDGVRQRYGTTS